jgi:hypothetical protein
MVKTFGVELKTIVLLEERFSILVVISIVVDFKNLWQTKGGVEPWFHGFFE